MLDTIKITCCLLQVHWQSYHRIHTKPFSLFFFPPVWASWALTQRPDLGWVNSLSTMLFLLIPFCWERLCEQEVGIIKWTLECPVFVRPSLPRTLCFVELSADFEFDWEGKAFQKSYSDSTFQSSTPPCCCCSACLESHSPDKWCKAPWFSVVPLDIAPTLERMLSPKIISIRSAVIHLWLLQYLQYFCDDSVYCSRALSAWLKSVSSCNLPLEYTL